MRVNVHDIARHERLCTHEDSRAIARVPSRKTSVSNSSGDGENGGRKTHGSADIVRRGCRRKTKRVGRGQEAAGAFLFVGG